jgi:hypothetical protein
VVSVTGPCGRILGFLEELLGRNSSGSSIEKREYDHRDLLCWPRNIFYRKNGHQLRRQAAVARPVY